MEDPSKPLLAEIREVQRMNAPQLLRRYYRFFDERVSHCTATLRREVIYKLQEEHYKLHISEAATKILNESLENRAAKKKEREVLTPGTQFVRQWRNTTHVLTYRGPKCYEYNGRTFRSASEVAKTITGVNWNGREFFKLPPLRQTREVV